MQKFITNMESRIEAIDFNPVGKLSSLLRLMFTLALFAALSFAFAPSVNASDPPPHPPAADAHEAPAEHGEESGEVEEAEEEIDRIVVIEPKKYVDPKMAADEILKDLELGRSYWKGGDYGFAEKYFAAALGVPGDYPAKEQVLFEMGELYQEAGFYPKAASAYERLAQEYPDSRRLPGVFMELGHLYREMGGLELAISKYYMVLNSALNGSIDQIDKNRMLSLKAKLEIAETHSEGLEYEESLRLYELLFRLDLEPVERKRVHYRICHLLYQLGEYQMTVSNLKLFLERYEESPHGPEMRYLLAKSYEKLDRKPEALREVVQILQRQSSPDTAIENDANYWKQRMGNELANEFYQKGDYRSALAIYQSLAKYSAAPEWRWPAVHQIGLCFERLGLPEKSIMAYQEILSPEEGTVGEDQLSPGMKNLRDMAKWRLEHLNWEDDLVGRLSVLSVQ